MRAAVLSILLALGSLAPTAGAEAAADVSSFAGTWRIDLERSDPRRGQNAPPLVDTELKISVEGEDVRVVRNFQMPQGARVLDVIYVTDGKPHEVAGPFGNPVVVRSRWAKDKLRISYTLSRGGFDLDITETWSVSDDGELVVLYSSRVGDQMNNRKELYVRSTSSG